MELSDDWLGDFTTDELIDGIDPPELAAGSAGLATQLLETATDCCSIWFFKRISSCREVS